MESDCSAAGAGTRVSNESLAATETSTHVSRQIGVTRSFHDAPVKPHDMATVRRVHQLVGIWSKFEEFDRRPIIQDERDPHSR